MEHDERKEEIIAAESINNFPAIPMSTLDLSKATKTSLSQISELGAAFAPLAQAITSMSTTTSETGETLCRVCDAAGKPIPFDKLSKFKDGTGSLGSYINDGSTAQARLKPFEGSASTAVSAIDPATLLVAITLVQVNQKLDAMSKMQQKMFAYAKQRDHAKLVGAFKVLDELRENYRYNSDNPAYISSRHHLVATAWRDAENAIELQREQLADLLKPLGLIHLGADVAKRREEMVVALRDYQLASYLYAYATLMDLTLVGNYEPQYLESVTSKMERYSQLYFEMFSDCADRIEDDALGTVEARAANGIGAAVGILGKLVAATPVGDATQIDETLLGGSGTIASLARGGADKTVRELAQARPGFMRPFIDSVREMDRLHNSPVVLAVGNGSVYVLHSPEDTPKAG